VTAPTILIRKTGIRFLALLFATAVSLTAATPAAAEPTAAPAGASITGVEQINDRWVKISVFSPAMNKVIVNDVYKSPKANSPTFYLLPGIDGGDNLDPGVYFAPGSKSWFGMTDVAGFFADKNVNVVSPLGGQFSWFTNWIGDASKQYQTYMTQELPPLIDKELKTNGRNAVGGLSSTGGTAIDYAVQAPGLYKAVGSYSGFPAPSDPEAAQQVSLTLMGGGASAEAMWGPLGGPEWVAHDPSKNVTKLKGVGVYAAASAGNQGEVDRLPPGAGNFTGGLIEGIVLTNTRKFADAASAAGVPITFVVRPEGSHTWGLFESEMQESWNLVIGPALGA
jgi:S-formylglutathione hydrolase FrmB